LQSSRIHLPSGQNMNRTNSTIGICVFPPTWTKILQKLKKFRQNFVSTYSLNTAIFVAVIHSCACNCCLPSLLKNLPPVGRAVVADSDVPLSVGLTIDRPLRVTARHPRWRPCALRRLAVTASWQWPACAYVPRCRCRTHWRQPSPGVMSTPLHILARDESNQLMFKFRGANLTNAHYIASVVQM
jgi:hypothetical protein